MKLAGVEPKAYLRAAVRAEHEIGKERPVAATAFPNTGCCAFAARRATRTCPSCAARVMGDTAAHLGLRAPSNTPIRASPSTRRRRQRVVDALP